MLRRGLVGRRGADHLDLGQREVAAAGPPQAVQVVAVSLDIGRPDAGLLGLEPVGQGGRAGEGQVAEGPAQDGVGAAAIGQDLGRRLHAALQ